MNSSQINQKENLISFVLLLFMPAFMSSNMIMARLINDDIPPLLLAHSRWLFCFLLLLPILIVKRRTVMPIIKTEWRELLLISALGMGVCGALPYVAAQTTTATNIALIYSASPIVIILMSALFYDEIIKKSQIIGIVIALIGVLYLISYGDFTRLLRIEIVVGDIWTVVSTLAWAFYSVLQRHRPSKLNLQARFAAMAGGGAIVLFPAAVIEQIVNQAPLFHFNGSIIDFQLFLYSVIFLALIPSIAAYLSYAKIQNTLGASKASLVMYAVPVYSVIMAAAILSEKIHDYHYISGAMVLVGLYLGMRQQKAKTSL